MCVLYYYMRSCLLRVMEVKGKMVDKNEGEGDDMDLPQGVVKMEKIVNEDGKKMKITKVVMYMEYSIM